MKTVIEMAREAGLLPLLDEDCFQSMGTKNFEATKRVLERFAELVRADEREAIAQSLDKQADLAPDEIDRQWAQEMAAAVRARGEKK